MKKIDKITSKCAKEILDPVYFPIPIPRKHTPKHILENYDMDLKRIARLLKAYMKMIKKEVA